MVKKTVLSLADDTVPTSFARSVTMVKRFYNIESLSLMYEKHELCVLDSNVLVLLFLLRSVSYFCQ